MKREQEYLLKHFASVLRKLALGKENEIKTDTNVAHCLTRKDLIQILKKQFGGTIPKEHDLVEMEKTELFELIENELFIISYMIEKWCGESSLAIGNKKPEKKETPKPNSNEKGTAQKK